MSRAQKTSRRRVLSGFVAAVVAACLLLYAPEAAASVEFSQAIQEALDMDCAAPCTICHRDNAGGLGTVRVEQGGKPFGEAMLEAGLLPQDTLSLRAALDVLEQAGVDSDEDGEADVAELSNMRDPNEPGAASVCGPTYGCAARTEPRARLDPAAALIAGLMMLGLLGLRRRPLSLCPSKMREQRILEGRKRLSSPKMRE